MTSGAEASNPTTSSMPASSGSAMLKPLETSPTTISLAGRPLCSRYCPQRLDRVDLAGPGLAVGQDDEGVDLELALGRVQHRQGAVGPAEGQALGLLDDVGQPGPGGDVQRDELRPGRPSPGSPARSAP